MLLGMLDMSAAFDTVDHDILLKRHHMLFGICRALSWISSFVRRRKQTVAVNGKMSETSLVTCSVPWGSALGPILFLLYTADMARIVKMHGMNFHSYADDSELYLHTKADDIALTLPRAVSCIDAIDGWMSLNHLKLNSDKTQFVVIGSRPQLSKVKCDSIRLSGLDIPFLQKVTCLGVILDTELLMEQYVRGVTSCCFNQLRQIRAIRKSMTAETSKLLVHALLTLD